MMKKEWTRIFAALFLAASLWCGTRLPGELVNAAGLTLEETAEPSADVSQEREQRLSSGYENLERKESGLEQRLLEARNGQGTTEEIARMEEELSKIQEQKQKIMQECFDK